MAQDGSRPALRSGPSAYSGPGSERTPQMSTKRHDLPGLSNSLLYSEPLGRPACTTRRDFALGLAVALAFFLLGVLDAALAGQL